MCDAIATFAEVDPSAAMVFLMHACGTACLAAAGSKSKGADAALKEIAAGKHLSTLAFSEAGSRSHFWAPLGTATQVDGQVSLDAQKSWVTSAGQADSYVWTSLPLAADGPMTTTNWCSRRC